MSDTPPPTPASMPAAAPHDVKVHATEIWIANILRVGVWVSLTLICVGTVVRFVRHPDFRSDPAVLKHLTDPGDQVPHRLSEVFHGFAASPGQTLVTLGLLTLITTPVLRVAASVIAFMAMRDRRFVLITLVVLTLLILSFFLGRVEA